MRYFGIVLLLLRQAVSAEPVREVEITSTPLDKGQQILNIRFTPGLTVQYEKITIDCVLHQEFPSEATHKAGGIKIHEPATFTYRRKDVRMVEDLDTHISFRVPTGMDRLMEMYGPTAFNTNFPVCVSRVIISASSTSTTWSCELPASGTHKPPFKKPSPTAP